ECTTIAKGRLRKGRPFLLAASVFVFHAAILVEVYLSAGTVVRRIDVLGITVGCGFFIRFAQRALDILPGHAGADLLADD
ncbi:MAG TPA: hypothetical protein PKJ88_03730, partial [Flexilinea sp.]|nr:hypothetical protein [Flexilinea sp.]